jgi:hypothetical protein
MPRTYHLEAALTTPHAGRHLGRNPADPARLARTVKLRFTGTLPPHPISADHLTSVPRWMLGGNDRFGTCGPTYVANSAVLTWHWLKGEEITVPDDAIWDLYRRSGNPNFNPQTDADDNGVDMTVMLSALVKGGITITHANGTTETIKPLAFAQHATDIDTVRAVTSIFGHDGFGLDLDQAQQAQTDRGLWDYAPSGPWGGHAVLGGSYTSAAGAGQRDESVVTWAEVCGTTDSFLSHQLSEAYVIVWAPVWDHPAFQAGVDQAALAADYQAVTGRPFPAPAPVPPPPPPPPPPPVPGTIRIDPADTALDHAIPTSWLHGRHIGDAGRVAGAIHTWRTAKGFPDQQHG